MGQEQEVSEVRPNQEGPHCQTKKSRFYLGGPGEPLKDFKQGNNTIPHLHRVYQNCKGPWRCKTRAPSFRGLDSYHLSGRRRSTSCTVLVCLPCAVGAVSVYLFILHFVPHRMDSSPFRKPPVPKTKAFKSPSLI